MTLPFPLPSPFPLLLLPQRTHYSTTSVSMAAISSTRGASTFDQNVIIMRHGDRMDNFDPLWVKTADHPWDPPLVDAGKARAFSTGRIFREDRIGFPIHRVFVSPFLRCVQTAAEAITAVCADGVDETKKSATDGVVIDPSRVKVSIEYGLCEMLNREAIRQECAPTDGDFRFEISELESLLPAGTIDHNVERVYEELPRWEETVLGAKARYEQVFQALADKYPSENLLLVTHGEGVATSVTSLVKGAVVYEVNYCAYSHTRRPVFEEDGTHKAGSFELLTPSGETGIKYYTGSSVSDGL